MADGLTDDQTRVAYDIGIHASNQALEAFGRIINTAPAELSTAAAIVANAHLLWRVKATIEAFTTHADPTFKENVEKAAEIMEREEGPKFAAFAAEGAKKYGLTPRG